MKVSVIVVSDNRRKLPHHSFNALSASTKNLDAEIILVAYGTNDAKAESFANQYPNVRFVNAGVVVNYPRAVNQGIQVAKGEYIAVIKCDAIIQPDTIKKAVDFMEQHYVAGGMSVRVLDNEGNFLQTSKRVLPISWVRFFKLTGLLRQFPKSRLTANTNAHHEDEFDTTETDILSDNFMVLRRSVINSIGLLDERFTQFGSNIDISYRIRLAGLKNYYFPKTYIIDPRCGKAAKFSWQYLKSFYGAMFIFALKYFFSLPALRLKPAQELYPAYELKG